MSSSGLIYAVIVGAWAAYLVPMWLRRQDELNEARPTERFSTAIRLLSGRAGMERRYAKDLQARSADEAEPALSDPDAVTDSVDVRAFAMPPTRPHTQVLPARGAQRPEPARERATAPADGTGDAPARGPGSAPGHAPGSASGHASGSASGHAPGGTGSASGHTPGSASAPASGGAPARGAGAAPARGQIPGAR
ncbi:hypothetical protein AB0K93_35870, partial [Streptomyces sp. NPDC052676]